MNRSGGTEARARICAVVPAYNHWRELPSILERLRAAGLTVYVIDDGSGTAAAAAIAALHDPAGGVEVHRLPVNQGKGAAVSHGFALAWDAGFSHAAQVDADGQHDLDALPDLLAASASRPEALISGHPIYDASIPRGRRIGRWVTHVWVWIETLSLQISDSMCGFRVYPLMAVRALLARAAVGTRMDFDTEIMVRLFRAGVPVAMVPVRVIYPPENTSNFRLLADNWLITRMHTRLMLEMPAWLLTRRIRDGNRGGDHAFARPPHWSGLGERGAWLGLWLSAWTARLLGRRGCLVLLAPVVLWFMLAGRAQRHASRQFLTRATGREPSTWMVYRHFMSFAARALDAFRAWTGRIPVAAVIVGDPALLAAMRANPAGAVMVVAHIGNVELARASLDSDLQERMTILVHTRHAVNYNRLLRTYRPDMARNLMQVTDIGPETAIALKERAEQGGWIVLAGDRTPVGGGGRTARVSFLGKDAAFALGPWIVASLLRCPVYLLSCMDTGNGTWRVDLEKFADAIVLPRADRDGALRGYAARYAARLEALAREAPLQWYNFFDFWAR